MPEDKDADKFISYQRREVEILNQDLCSIEKKIIDIHKKSIFKPIEHPNLTSIDNYEEVGKILICEERKQTPLNPSYPAIFQEISHLSSSIYINVKESNSYIPPSIMICASPGIGKTQIPFTLDIPLLYYSLFMYSKSINKDLIKFPHISLIFLTATISYFSDI